MNMHVATTPERIRGTTMVTKARNLLAPRSCAACSISSGTSSMKDLVIQTA